MSALLTHENISYLKGELRRKYPHVKSSHMTEALARHCGFRTHASLLAELTAQSGRRPKVLTFCETPGEGVASQIDAADVVHAARSPLLPHPMWFEPLPGDLEEIDWWMQRCVRDDVPCIWIEPKEGAFEVNWDYDTRNSAHYESLRQASKNGFINIMYNAFCALATSKNALFEGTVFTGYVRGVQLDEARELSEVLYCLMDSALTRSDLS
jgi:hypothetical protein